MEPNPVVIVTGSTQHWKCPRGACRCHAAVFQKTHLLFKVCVHRKQKKLKKNPNPDSYSKNAIFIVFHIFTIKSTEQHESLVQPHVFFIPSWCRQSSQTYTLQRCSRVHCQKVLRTRLVADHFPYKQCKFWSGPVTVNSSEELHKHKLGTTSNTVLVLSWRWTMLASFSDGPIWLESGLLIWTLLSRVLSYDLRCVS